MTTYKFHKTAEATPAQEKPCTKCSCNKCFNEPRVETYIDIKPNKDPNKSPWVIHKTIITDIKSLSYYEAALQKDTSDNK